MTKTCPHCFEKNCICIFAKCCLCKQEFLEGEMYEYRGFLACGDCHDKVIERVDEKRQEVMEVTEHAIASQRRGHFVNNLGDKSMKFASDGLPIIPVREPQILKDYENGIL